MKVHILEFKSNKSKNMASHTYLFLIFIVYLIKNNPHVPMTARVKIAASVLFVCSYPSQVGLDVIEW